MDCLFCKIVSGDIPADVVFDGERTLAFRDIAPKAPVHILVVPKVHYPDAATVAAADPALVGELITTAGQVAADQGVSEGGYRMIFNTGADGGQTVFHAHLHLLAGTKLPW
ncbi:histidine triad nucleotide-binding protein [Nakamurella silvestris]|nr:histidine triad nucleotide-binding protein [Nakamurella silvestris]